MYCFKPNHFETSERIANSHRNMLQNYYQTKKLNKKLVERQVKRPVEKKVKDNIKELETNKEKGGVHQLVYFESLAIMVVVKKHGNNF
jgi:hypothetical protein